ncbi:non-homologous end joining protein Ku [Streptomyces griseoviridis]|uniref:Non-homologous end joining protein Ku n=1 Tax=Streptomyces griseoviridis TaxID=45398 RepID=A0ABT9LL64_STRGD|nr:Ku protein [Streptomyces griseoviridis]MDP9684067.1 DNA end-binding protein Ku [Streptomyces griseoviridis]
MRSIWNGAISFGLVSIPIKLVNATENHAVSFRQIHTEDGGRIRYRKVCELEDREVSQAEIGKGYEDADGSIVPITDEDLSALPIPTARTIEIVAFVPEDRIDPLQMSSAYYLAASGAPAAKPYTLLREALKRSNRVAIAKYALRGRERLGMLRVVDDAIAMHGLLWPDEVRAPEGVAPDTDVTVRDQELDLADALMDTLGEIDLSELHDEYREAVEEVIAAKSAGEAPPETPRPATSGKVLDLMAALENSVRAARESRGEGEGEGEGEGGSAEVTRLPRREPAASGGRKTAPGGGGGKKTQAEPATRSATAEGTADETGKKSTARKSTAKSATAKSATPKSATPKSAAKGATAKKASTGKATAGKSTAEKSTAGKAASGRTTSGKAASGKATGQAASGKATGEKASARKTPAKKTTSGRRSA